MKYRQLRIAWSVAWGVVAVLLCVLWVRSYWRIDGVTAKSPTGMYVCYSQMGIVEIGWVADDSTVFGPGPTFDFGSSPVSPATRRFSNLFWRWFQLTPGALVIPHWFLTMLVAGVAASSWLPWIRFGFSLRALLIATTLAAIGLGLGVWLSR